MRQLKSARLSTGARRLLVVGSVVIATSSFVPAAAMDAGPALSADRQTPAIITPRAPAAQTFGPPLPQNQFARNPSAYTSLFSTANGAGWVNTATGAFVTSAEDVQLSGVVMPFVFARSYTSADGTAGPLGPGWTHSLNWALSAGSGGQITVRSGEGQQLTFLPQPSGGYAAMGALSTLVATTGGYRLTLHDQVRHDFTKSGRLVTTTDRNGNALSYAYDASGRLRSVTDTAHRVITVTYSAGLLIGLRLPDGRTVSYAYTGGLLTGVTDPSGHHSSYGYTAGRLTALTDPNGNGLAHLTYDASGRAVKQVDALGNATTFFWNPATQTATKTDARGLRWVDVFASNVLQSRTDPIGDKISRAHDVQLNVVSQTDANNRTTRFGYDTHGNVTKTTAPAPLSYMQTLSYDARNDPLSFTDGRGQTTTFTYDANGNLVRRTQPNGVATTYAYDLRGLVTSATDPRGNVWRRAYDSAGNLTSANSPVGSTTTFNYDASGRPTRMTDPNGNATTFVYDPSDRPLSRTDALGETTSFTYDSTGNLISRTDANGHATLYQYDAASRLTRQVSPLGEMTSYSYDATGNRISRTDANGHATLYQYDAANRLTGRTAPLGQTWRYAHDSAGNLTQIVDAAGGTTTLRYDAINRLVGKQYSDSSPAVAFTYDADSNRLSMSDGAGTATYTYDPLGRLASTRRGADAFSYAYDPIGDLTAETYPDGTGITYQYDAAERMTSMAIGAAVTTYSYDQVGNRLTRTLPSGIIERRSYDKAGRLLGVVNQGPSSVLSSYVDTLDAVGNPTSETTTTSRRLFQYDADNRLVAACTTSCTGSNPFTRWTYDGVSNRLTEAGPAGTTTYIYNADDELLSMNGPTGINQPATVTNFFYDPNGYQVAEGSATQAFNVAGDLTLFGAGPFVATYIHDGDHNLTSESVGPSVINLKWDPYENRLATLSSGPMAETFTFSQSDVNSLFTGGKRDDYLKDPRGSVVFVTSAAGAKEWNYDYAVFGRQTATKDDPNAPPNPVGFKATIQDPVSGLQVQPPTSKVQTPVVDLADPCRTTLFACQEADAAICDRGSCRTQCGTCGQGGACDSSCGICGEGNTWNSCGGSNLDVIDNRTLEPRGSANCEACSPYVPDGQKPLVRTGGRAMRASDVVWSPELGCWHNPTTGWRWYPGWGWWPTFRVSEAHPYFDPVPAEGAPTEPEYTGPILEVG